MKKIIALTLLALTFSTSAFAAALATNALPGGAGYAIFGGTTAAEATGATNPLVRTSTGVWGVVNFTAASNLSTSYAIFTKHTKGSKLFGTANDSTNIYWKASPAVKVAPFLAVAECGTGTDNSNFGTGWTAY
jgi:hypothetical protein